MSFGFFPSRIDSGIIAVMTDAIRLYENCASLRGFAEMASSLAIELHIQGRKKLNTPGFMIMKLFEKTAYTSMHFHAWIYDHEAI
jgi:hypothetical protein